MAIIAILILAAAIVGIGAARYRVSQRRVREERRRQRRAIADAQWQAMMAGRGEDRRPTA